MAESEYQIDTIHTNVIGTAYPLHTHVWSTPYIYKMFGILYMPWMVIKMSPTQGPQTHVLIWYKPHYYDMVEPETTSDWIAHPSYIYI